MNRHQRGFTVIELIVIIVLLGAASVLFFIQKNNLQVAANDQTRKVAINAMYYSLENVFYPANSYYPQSISSTILPSVDPTLFTDPKGHVVSTAGSDYSYMPTNCSDGHCKSYTLRAHMQNEADYIKDSKNS